MWVNLFLDFLLFWESIIFANNTLYWLTLWYILKLGTVYTWFLFVCLSKWILKLFCQSLEKKKSLPRFVYLWEELRGALVITEISFHQMDMSGAQNPI